MGYLRGGGFGYRGPFSVSPFQSKVQQQQALAAQQGLVRARSEGRTMPLRDTDGDDIKVGSYYRLKLKDALRPGLNYDGIRYLEAMDVYKIPRMVRVRKFDGDSLGIEDSNGGIGYTFSCCMVDFIRKEQAPKADTIEQLDSLESIETIKDLTEKEIKNKKVEATSSTVIEDLKSKLSTAEDKMKELEAELEKYKTGEKMVIRRRVRILDNTEFPMSEHHRYTVGSYTTVLDRGDGVFYLTDFRDTTDWSINTHTVEVVDFDDADGLQCIKIPKGSLKEIHITYC